MGTGFSRMDDLDDAVVLATIFALGAVVGGIFMWWWYSGAGHG